MNPFIQAIYCDDIRREDSGKLFFVGVYQQVMYAQEFPLELPKFCIYTDLLTPATKPFSPGTLRIYKDDEILRERELTGELAVESEEIASQLPDDEIEDRVMRLSTIYVFTPFRVETPCLLRIRFETDDQEIRGLGLKIEKIPSDEE